MPGKKHKIPRSDAKKMVKEFDRKKAQGKETIKDIPDGFIFKADEVRELLNTPLAESFVIRFGWKKTRMGNGTEKEMIAPILLVLDANNNIIEDTTAEDSENSPAMTTRSTEESGGGYLDEGDPIPPPPVDFDS